MDHQKQAAIKVGVVTKKKNRHEVQTLMFCESVNNIASLSMPIPQPPVGGNPYSRAVQNVSSKAIASSSPDCLSC